MAADYGNSSYWDERYAYAGNSSFDWYQDYSTLKTYLDPFLNQGRSNNGDADPDSDFEILIPGCGNSSLGSNIYQDGCYNITNIDLSTVVISQMKEKYSYLEEMEFTVMDALRMDYIPNECFDLIIDKGLFDCQLCSQKNISNIQLLVKEMCRVLKPGGHYIMISHGSPDNRLGYLQRILPWKVEFKAILFDILLSNNHNRPSCYEIAKPPLDNNVEEEELMRYHYLYICTKDY